MPRGNLPSRKDRNHKEVVTTLEQCGYSVSDTSAVGTFISKLGHASGSLDLFVAKHGITILVEVKVEGASLNRNETVFWNQWKGEKVIGYSGADAYEKCELIVTRYMEPTGAYPIQDAA